MVCPDQAQPQWEKSAPLTDHWTFWKVLWLSNAGSGKHSAFWLWHTRDNIRTLLLAPQGPWIWCHTEGPLLQVNQMRFSSWSDESTSGGRCCGNLEKSICCSVKEGVCDGVQAVLSFLATWLGNYRGKRQGHPKSGSGWLKLQHRCSLSPCS